MLSQRGRRNVWHDARLDRLLRVPEPELCRLNDQDKNIVWQLLAIRAGYIRLGLIPKYWSGPPLGGVVEDCEIVSVSDTLERLRDRLRFGTVPTRGIGRRLCLICPYCGR